MFPVGLAIANARFSTVLLSFGGVFRLLFFIAWNPAATVRAGNQAGSVIPGKS